jgi:hypothetical protein
MTTTLDATPTRSVFDASRSALGALVLRDLVVLRKTFREFVLRTLIQPFLLCFVFLFVFPKIGQAVGSLVGLRDHSRPGRGGHLHHVSRSAVHRPHHGPGVRIHPRD